MYTVCHMLYGMLHAETVCYMHKRYVTYCKFMRYKPDLKFIICKYWVESNETLPILPDGTKYELIIEEDFE